MCGSGMVRLLFNLHHICKHVIVQISLWCVYCYILVQFCSPSHDFCVVVKIIFGAQVTGKKHHMDSEEQQKQQDGNADADTANEGQDGEERLHAGFESLKLLLAAQLISNDKFNKYQKVFQLMHKTFMRVQHSETVFLSKGKQLKQEVTLEKNKFEEIEKMRLANSQILQDLKRESTRAENQLASSQDNESQLQTNQIELERKLQALKSKYKMLLDEQAAQERPMIEFHQSQNTMMEREIQHLKEQFAREETNRISYLQQIEELTMGVQSDVEERRQLKEAVILAKVEPERTRKQFDFVSRVLSDLQTQMEGFENKFQDLEMNYMELEKQKEYTSSEIHNKELAEQKTKLKVHSLKDIQVKTRKEVEDAKENNRQLVEEGVTRQIALDEISKRFNEEMDKIRKLQKDEATNMTLVQQTERIIKSLQSDKEKVDKVQENVSKELETLRQQAEETRSKTDAIDKEVEILIHDFIIDDQENKGFGEKVKEKRDEMEALEKRVTDMGSREREDSKLLSELSLAREKESRKASKTKQLFVDTMGELKIKFHVNAELLKKSNELETKIKLFKKMYSLMKQEKNKYALQIQESAQIIAEIREKNKILENEQEVYTKKRFKIEKDMQNVKRSHNEIFQVVQNLKAEKSKLVIALTDKSSETTEHMMEIDKLNTITNVTEEDMLLLKQQFEKGVQQRNYTGIQLIDTNDELCILYEKSNIQDDIVKNGEMELRKKEQETRMLALDLENLQRELRVVYKNIPDLLACEREREELVSQIQNAKSENDKLSHDLEDPNNKTRWRQLEGKIPTEEQLKENIQELEEKMNSRKEQLMEKNLLLQEITKTSDQLRKWAVSNRDQTYDMAVGMNSFQHRIRDTNRRMMACVSELTIYQATAMSLEEKNKELTKLVDAARMRLSQGVAPTEDVEYELYKASETEQRYNENLRVRKERMENEKDLPPTITRTTALQRPNSYIPDDDLGIPRPYLNAPFMYTEAGATMRHIRKPVPKQILI